MKKKKVIRVDLFKFIRSVFILLGIMLVILLYIGKVIYSHEEIENKEIIVTENETLWSIASYEQKHNDFYKDKSISYIMDDIKEGNNMNMSMIYEGQILKIKTY